MEYTAEKEFESTVTLSIPKKIYDEILNDLPVIEKYTIFYFQNGSRMSKDKIQMKKVHKRTNILKILTIDDNFLFLPFTRKYSLEHESAVPQNLSTIETAILRSVIYYQKEDGIHIIRISVECVSTTSGIMHQITAEIEYQESTWYYYTSLMAAENLLLDIIKVKIGAYIKNIRSEDTFKFKDMSNIVHVPSRRFNMFHKTYSDSKNEIKTYKFDGYKGRMYIKNKQLFFYDDLHNMGSTTCEALSFVENIFFQIEVMKSGYLIITDVLGGYTGNNVTNESLYMPEPLTVLLFFINLRKHWKAQGIVEPIPIIFGKQTFKMFTQYPVLANTPVPDQSILPFDGYIITKEDKIFKLKVPTVDVRVKNGYLYIDSIIASISAQKFNNFANNKIFEISPNRCTNNSETEFIILRQRNDKNVTSTPNEYDSFTKELQYMLKNM